jgi:hypothetical protein
MLFNETAWKEFVWAVSRSRFKPRTGLSAAQLTVRTLKLDREAVYVNVRCKRPARVLQ